MISVAIIHCPRSVERVENVRSLVAALPGAVIVEDDGTAVGRRWDRQGCGPIALRAWRLSCAGHHLVLEDDAMLCDRFMDRLKETIELDPSACISLFRGKRDCSVGTVIPRWLVDRWLDWCAESPHGSRYLPHHDYLITQGMRELGVRHLYAAPSLVDQRAFPSLLGHRHVQADWFERDPSNVTLVART